MLHRTAQSLRLPATLASAVALTSCASPLAQRAQNSDGLLGFVFNYPGPNTVPVERVSRGSGEIVTAHAVADGKQLRVSGLVRKAGLHDPPYGAHVDVLVLNASGKVIDSTTSDYNPRHFPRRIRGNRGTSHYIARLPAIPPVGAKVQVIFHGAKRTECPHAHGT